MGLLAFAPIAAWGVSSTAFFSYERLVIEAIRKRLWYLSIDSATLSRFASDYTNAVPKSSLSIMLIAIGVNVDALFPHISRLRNRVEYFEEYVATYFLNCSDFFHNGADESREVKYLGISFADIYERPCNNPFAKFEDL